MQSQTRTRHARLSTLVAQVPQEVNQCMRLVISLATYVYP